MANDGIEKRLADKSRWTYNEPRYQSSKAKRSLCCELLFLFSLSSKNHRKYMGGSGKVVIRTFNTMEFRFVRGMICVCADRHRVGQADLFRFQRTQICLGIGVSSVFQFIEMLLIATTISLDEAQQLHKCENQLNFVHCTEYTRCHQSIRFGRNCRIKRRRRANKKLLWVLCNKIKTKTYPLRLRIGCWTNAAPAKKKKKKKTTNRSMTWQADTQ